MRHSVKKIFANTCLLIAASFISLWIAEGVARIVIPLPSKKTFRKEDVYLDEELTGWRFKSGKTSRMKNIDFDIEFYISQANIRVNNSAEIKQYTPDYIRNLNKSKKRVIIAIGDSQTFGHGLKNQNSWPSELNTFLGRDLYYVANFGMPGTDPNQFTNLTRRLTQKYPNIDSYIYGLSDNDLCQYPSNALRKLDSEAPISTIFSGPNIKLSPENQNSTLHSFANSFAIGKILIQVHRKINGYLVSKSAMNPSHSSLNQKIEKAAHQCSVNTLRWIEGISKALSKKGKKSYFVLIPKGETIISQKNNALATGQAKLLRAVEIIENSSDPFKVKIINAYPSIMQSYSQSGAVESIMLPSDGHSNHLANIAIAQEIYSEITSNQGDLK